MTSAGDFDTFKTNFSQLKINGDLLDQLLLFSGEAASETGQRRLKSTERRLQI